MRSFDIVLHHMWSMISATMILIMISTAEIMLYIWWNTILKLLILMLTVLTSKPLILISVITKRNGKLLSLYRSKIWDLHYMYRRNECLWNSLIKQSITHTGTSRLCNIGIIILIVYYPLPWKLLLLFRVLLVYRFYWCYFKNGYWKMLAEILIWNKKKHFRSCFYYILFEQKWTAFGYYCLLSNCIPESTYLIYLIDRLSFWQK